MTVATRLVPLVDRRARALCAGRAAAECAQARFYSREGRGSLLADFIDSCLGTLEWAGTSDAGLPPADLAYYRASRLRGLALQGKHDMAVDAAPAETRLVEIVACSGAVCTLDFPHEQLELQALLRARHLASYPQLGLRLS